MFCCFIQTLACVWNDKQLTNQFLLLVVLSKSSTAVVLTIQVNVTSSCVVKPMPFTSLIEQVPKWNYICWKDVTAIKELIENLTCTRSTWRLRISGKLENVLNIVLWLQSSNNKWDPLAIPEQPTSTAPRAKKCDTPNII